MKTSSASRNEKIEMKCKELSFHPTHRPRRGIAIHHLLRAFMDIFALVRALLNTDIGGGSYAEVNSLCMLPFLCLKIYHPQWSMLVRWS